MIGTSSRGPGARAFHRTRAALLALAVTACVSRAKEVTSIRAEVTGLEGSGLVLTLNGVEVPVAAAGVVELGSVPQGLAYEVGVKTQPASPAQRCSVTRGIGVMGSESVAIPVACVRVYAVAGHVSGLRGTGLSLQLSVGEEHEALAVGADAFSFAMPVAAGAAYVVRVLTDPTDPVQRCTVESPTGQGAAGIDVNVVCSTQAYVVRGTVQNLLGSGLVLQLNGAGDLAVPAGATSFSFPAMADGSGFEVTVRSDPSGPSQRCEVTGGKGTLAGADAGTVAVSCTTRQFAIMGSVTGPVADGLVLSTPGAPDLAVGRGATVFVFAGRLDSGSRYEVKVKAQPAVPSQACTVANADGTVGEADVVNVAVTCHTQWSEAVAGGSHTVALAKDGTLWAWGNNVYGALGDGTVTSRTTPVQVGTGRLWKAISAGWSHTVAIAQDGTLWVWGYNVGGRLASGPTNLTAPVQVGSGTSWTSVFAGGYHTVALAEGGALWTWGDNEMGQLNDGTTTPRSAPVQVGAGTPWTAVSAGGYHTAALAQGGALWAWGFDEMGQVGDGTAATIRAPVQVKAGTPWTSVAAGGFHTVAIAQGGALWAWGDDSYGQLGDGGTGTVATPVAVGVGTLWTAVSAGQYHTAALSQGGALWSFGWNTYGQLGIGSTESRSTPVQVGSGTPWAAVSAGGRHTVALAQDGTLWAFGNNANGQLGDGTTTNRLTPTLIW